ncbi:MBL fold metallo-hydrolase [Thermoflavifilum thermophilum]|uniref:Glyoxylase, beta-lactamase superfamily II n=1 Tax=Thermoflavifilum thermophilum TaxID=1393122 RepID=A0A1I7NA45_9BACT|nr:MBL fold metallo-hydrolase [Thermoflavifilum thermophilum]SFV31544.1 Glyoxylase, beta-lactamase superfamily II [Thermoflavifilum thermophilum]
MLIKQMYTGCLSEAAYFIASEGEAAVIDPLRDTEAYLEMAAQTGSVIRYIFETHFHADFVSGHLDLAEKTGAQIVFGPQAATEYRVHIARDGEEFQLGKIKLQLLHTPGHTIESSCYLLYDESGKPYCLFTGDTLFVGDVGRPDLSSGGFSAEELAGYLFDSLQQKIKPLPDDLIIYPAHGPGSACGKQIGKETFSTLGEQKQSNYALLADDRQTFIEKVTHGLSQAPPYFHINARINQKGYEQLHRVLERSLVGFTVTEFKQHMRREQVLCVDTRAPETFVEGFIPGFLNIGLRGRFAEWAGRLLPYHRPILLVTDPGKEEEAITRLARVGFDSVMGYLQGGFQAWLEAGEPRDMIITVDPEEFALDIPYDQRMVILDVRHETEHAQAHVRGSINIPLEDMRDPVSLMHIEDHHNLYVHCETGYRSVIACSLLKQQGIHNLRNIAGGFREIRQQPQIEIVEEKNVLN